MNLAEKKVDGLDGHAVSAEFYPLAPEVIVLDEKNAAVVKDYPDNKP